MPLSNQSLSTLREQLCEGFCVQLVLSVLTLRSVHLTLACTSHSMALNKAYVVHSLLMRTMPAICSSIGRHLYTTSSINQQSDADTLPTAQVGRLNHVAIAVPDLEKAAERYKTVLGATVSKPQPVPEHGVTVVFVELPNTKIELLHPLGGNSPIKKFLERNPSGGIHHLCLEVADVKQSLAALSPWGMRVLDPEPKIGAHGNPVVFMHPKDNDGVLMELEEVQSSR